MSRPGFRVRVVSVTPTNRRRPSRLRVEGLEDRTVPSFVAADSFPVGPNGGQNAKPVAIATGDFNEDGHQDVATANNDATYVSILKGLGDGTFAAADNLSIGQTPVYIRAADVNADTHLDLITANRSTNSVSVLLGLGDGTFQMPAAYNTGTTTSPVSFDVADVDGDTDLDLAVAHGGASTVGLMLNDGSGLFVPGTNVNVAVNPTSVVLADVSGDNLPDVLSVNGGSGGLTVNLATGGGTYGGPTPFTTGFVPTSLAVGDFNGDTKRDVAVAHAFPSGDGVSVLLGNGNGTFQPYVEYSAGGQTPATLAVVDLNGDGVQDLVTANGYFANNSISLLLGNPNGTFGAAKVYHAGMGPVAVATGDFNDDGAADVVTADNGGTIGTVSLLRGNGDGTLRATPALVVGDPGAVVATDFTNDGKPDIAVVTWEVGYNGITLFPGLGNGAFGNGVRTAPISMVTGLAAGDFNGDGSPDLAVTGSAGVTILINNGSGSFAVFGSPLAAGSGPSWVASDDFNGDAYADLAVANGSGVSLLLGNGNGTFGAASPVTAGGAASFLTTADLDLDTDADLAVINGSAATVSVVLGNGDGTFAAPTSYTTRTGPGSVSVGDLDGDDLPELVVPTFFGPGASSAFTVFANMGGGAFGTGPETVTGSRPIGSAVLDLDADGFNDVVTVNNFADTTIVFFGDGIGGFGNTETYAVGDRPDWVAAADFNGDTRPDLAVTNGNSGTLSTLTTPKPATHFGLTLTGGGTTTAGVTFQLTVTALDASEDPVPDFRGAVSFTSDDGQATLPANYTFTAADAGEHTFDITLRSAGAREVTVTGPFGSFPVNVQVDAAAASELVFTVPTQATAGAAFDVTVTVFDEFDNIATGFSDTVGFDTDDPHAAAVVPSGYTFTAQDAGVHTFTGGVTLATAGSLSVTAAVTGLPQQVSNVTVSPAVAAKLTLGGPTTATAGTTFPMTVTALDPYDNRATAFTGLVQFTTSDPIADLPIDYTFVPADQGIRSFQVTLKRGGFQSVTVSSAGLTGATQNNIQVSAATATQVAWVGTPANTFVLTAAPTPVTVQVQDAHGNPVAAAGVSVTLSLGVNPNRARLRGMTAVTDFNGRATFPKLMLTRPAAGYTLVAQSSLGTSAASDPFTVYTAVKFKVTASVTKSVAGDTFSVTVTALNGRNQVDPTYRGTVRFTATGTQFNLPADYTFTAADAGQHTFIGVALNTAGRRRLTVSDAAKARVLGRAVVTVTAGEATGFTITGFPLTVRANAARTFVVTAVDQFGNRATTYTGSVTFSSVGGAVLPAAYEFTDRQRGRKAFVAKFPTVGSNLSLTATDNSATPLTGTLGGITVI